ncbi:PREDICTED: uncharacterized protein LOC109481752 [Branchiostoma belcheri]|uniref:Uncharacterized protein LOC109481752 n=1 Tax=Branchiostoma belcheri TaxID=7741 RepID=A0A6P4ZST7_BRABE|nr:PREDICTED: uncharacterized protein LOC109481752 [Branchiostoma belcheri]
MTEEFKVGKARALLTLEGSRDPRVSQAGIQLRSGRKWAVDKAVDEAKSRLRHSDIVGVVAQGRLGLGAGKVASQRWGTAGPKERRDMVQREVRRKEEEGRKSLAVSQGVQGAWTKWEGVRSRCVKWSDLWKCEPLRIQFLLRSVYDLLPTPVNLKRWGKEKEEKCQLCERRGTLSHVLSSCPIALGQGRYRWRHDQVLRVLACTLEEERTKKRGKNRKGPKFIGFVREGEGEKRKTGTKDRERGILPTASDWNLRVDLDRRLVFPEEISSTNLKPDVVLWSTQTKQIVLVELTVPWEERIEEAYERKALKYQNLLQDCVEKGWRSWCFPIEIGCRGFVAQSAWRALGTLGIVGKQRRDTVSKMAETAEVASRWVWRNRQSKWKPTTP